MMMKTMFITFLMSGWRQKFWKIEGIRKLRDTPRSQFRKKSGLMIQERNN